MCFVPAYIVDEMTPEVEPCRSGRHRHWISKLILIHVFRYVCMDRARIPTLQYQLIYSMVNTVYTKGYIIYAMHAILPWMIEKLHDSMCMLPCCLCQKCMHYA